MNIHVTIPQKMHINANKNLIEVLKPITEVLQKSYRLLQQVARRATNKKLQIVIYNIAAQVNKHYHELSSQFQLPANKLPEWNFILLPTEKKVDNSEELMNDCSAIENAVIKCYCNLLRDSLFKPEAEALLQQHLNGFLSAFEKLKTRQSFIIAT